MPIKRIKKILRNSAGYLLVVLGIIGFLIPVIPGFLLILAGLYCLEGGWLKKKVEIWRARKTISIDPKEKK